MGGRRSMGNVRPHGTGFQAYITISGTVFRRSFETEDDAWSWLATVKADAVRGVLKAERKKQEIHFEDLCRLYKVSRLELGKWRPDTVRFFDAHVKSTLKPEFGTTLVSKITSDRIQRFLVNQLARVSARTVTKYQQVMTQVLNFAVRKGYLDRSPMVGVERVQARQKSYRVLRLHELQAIVATCPEEHRAFITILALTGLRKSEIFRLSWDWCDFEKGRLLIKVAKRGENEMPMSARVREALLSLGPRSDGRVFPGSFRDKSGKERCDGTKLITNKRHAIAKALEAAKVDPKGVAYHTFRRTFVTLVEALPGVSYGVVRVLARHAVSSHDMTERYVYVSEDRLHLALEQLEEQVLGPSNVIVFPQVQGARG